MLFSPSPTQRRLPRPAIRRLNTQLEDGTWALSPEDEADMHRHALTLIGILCPDGDDGAMTAGHLRAYTRLMQIALAQNDPQLDAIRALNGGQAILDRLVTQAGER